MPKGWLSVCVPTVTLRAVERQPSAQDTGAFDAEISPVKYIQSFYGLINVFILVVHFVMSRALDYQQIPFVGSPFEKEFAILEL
jgi:hypothetical protein